jgi:hypothetical protein
MVGVGNPIAVPSMARLGAGRGDSGSCDPRDQLMFGSLCTEGFCKYYVYINAKISLSASPILRFKANTLPILSCPRTRHASHKFCGGEEGT